MKFGDARCSGRRIACQSLRNAAGTAAATGRVELITHENS